MIGQGRTTTDYKPKESEIYSQVEVTGRNTRKEKN